MPGGFHPQHTSAHQRALPGIHWNDGYILCHPREIFRLAVMASASAIIIAHNHPSGDPTPSEADIKITRDLIRAGQLLKIEVLDHIVMGHPSHTSLRSLGYFYS